jgi:hypothetical protein
MCLYGGFTNCIDAFYLICRQPITSTILVVYLSLLLYEVNITDTPAVTQ